jgi:hypothetical protein
MRTVLRIGGLAIAIGVAFETGRVSSTLQHRASGPAPVTPGATADPGSPSGPPPWATHGFRDGETCEDVFQNPG